MNRKYTLRIYGTGSVCRYEWGHMFFIHDCHHKGHIAVAATFEGLSIETTKIVVDILLQPVKNKWQPEAFPHGCHLSSLVMLYVVREMCVAAVIAFRQRA